MNRIEQIAKVCHEVNRAYCASLGDFSQPSWETAPQWQKESANKGVEFHLSHPDSKPSDSHQSWLEHKRAEGWVYGEKKDPEKKTHPDMVPFEKLPYEERLKDILFLAVVRSMEHTEQDNLAEAIDELDDCAAALSLPLADNMHVESLRKLLPEKVSVLKSAYVEITGDNPWD